MILSRFPRTKKSRRDPASLSTYFPNSIFVQIRKKAPNALRHFDGVVRRFTSALHS